MTFTSTGIVPAADLPPGTPARTRGRWVRAALAVAFAFWTSQVAAVEPDWAQVPAGAYTSVLKLDDVGLAQQVEAFELMTRPVTNGEFLEFVRRYPDWRRDRAPRIFVDENYLAHWSGPTEPGSEVRADQPVTQVSWFAALAYCEAQHARLPTWGEWEYVAAADETRADARSDPAWRERILGWYSRPGGRALPPVGKTPANLYGIRDLHGLVWEWVEDFNAMMVSADNREQGDPDILRFCGAGAISMADRENYAVLMRTALLSSLQAGSTTRNLGFRCARDLQEPSP
ncbi:MAG TPA: formylglycine-generating enzyme family protein [Xanthomonadaceae bacterium]|nr:formylglycine-generating enzyme family protein [Xanthomonadaceae bacterium]